MSSLTYVPDWGVHSPAASIGPLHFANASDRFSSTIRRLDDDLAWLEANEVIEPDGASLTVLRGQPALAAKFRNLCETLQQVPGIKLHIVIHREPDEGHDKPVVVYSMPKGHSLYFSAAVPAEATPTLFKTMRAFQRELESFRTLPTDWNSYRSRTISPVAIDRAHHLLWLILEQQWIEAGLAALPDFVVPAPEGGVQYEWRRNEHELEIEIGPTGDYGFLSMITHDGKEFPEEAEQVALPVILSQIASIILVR